MATFLEGVGAVAMACTLVIGLPTLAIALAAGRRAPWVVAGSVPATGLVMWAKAAGVWNVAGEGWLVVPIAVLIAGAFVAAWRSDSLSAPAAVGVGALGGGIAGWLWRPCVGEQLALVLNDAETDALSSIPRMLAYTSGALLPTILLAALPFAWPRLAPVLTHRRLATGGLAFGGLYALTVISGRYNDLVGELFRISST